MIASQRSRVAVAATGVAAALLLTLTACSPTDDTSTRTTTTPSTTAPLAAPEYVKELNCIAQYSTVHPRVFAEMNAHLYDNQAYQFFVDGKPDIQTISAQVSAFDAAYYAVVPDDFRNRYYNSLITPATLTDGPNIPGATFTFRWSARNPDDLMSADGTFIRAYLESKDSLDTGKPTTMPLYPGFDRASNGLESIWARYGNGSIAPALPNYSPGEKFPATEYFDLAAVTTQPDGTAQALICGHRDLILRYRRQGTAPATDQRGAAAHPGTNVFGDWQAVANGPTDQTDAQNACKAAGETFDHDPHAAAPPAPGWP